MQLIYVSVAFLVVARIDELHALMRTTTRWNITVEGREIGSNW